MHKVLIIKFCLRDEYLAKIARRVKEYEVKVLNEPRSGKKLLVLDVDYTLFGRNVLFPKIKVLSPNISPCKTTKKLEMNLFKLYFTKIRSGC